MPSRESAIALAGNDPALLEAIRRARKLLNRRALAGAAAGAVPVPGLDWLVDAALISKLMPAINAEFGLTPEQLDRLPKRKQEEVQKAIGVVGSMLIGKFITREMVVKMAQTIGVRMTAKTAAKYVPLAGQAVSALIGYTAIRYLGESHIRDCVAVCKAAHLKLPAPR
ncbi:hypothetical protein [Ramlibacter albus]|uniref:DUF697 domain-containing protein n=1 Tax=Ramlibacter albus TaxID=2079448 RepID=A0A923M8H9_9BURK|nr:hypothetical protein [Ramlibacter albus]MBC5764462.1 hypothetical protein [Ramlibacter albus]